MSSAAACQYNSTVNGYSEAPALCVGNALPMTGFEIPLLILSALLLIAVGYILHRFPTR